MAYIDTAVGIVFVMLAWRAWRRTILDTMRDALFDLRDHLLRPRYINGDLSEREYRMLRDRINAAIRYLDKATFWGLLWIGTRSAELNELHEQLKKLKGEPPLTTEAEKYLGMATACVVAYAVFSSVFGLVLVLITLVLGAFKHGWRSIRSTIAAARIAGPMGAATLVALIMFQSAVHMSAFSQRKADEEVKRVFVEEVTAHL